MITVRPMYDPTADVAAAAAISKGALSFSKSRAAITALQYRLDDKHKYRLIVDGSDIPIKAATLMTSMDAAADGFTAVVPYDERTELLFGSILSPPATPYSEVYLGGKKMFSGYLFGRKASFNETGRYRTLVGWSPLANAIDSVVSPPFEFNAATLTAYATTQLAGFGIPVIWQGGVDTPFSRIKADKDAKVGDQLFKLCRQRGVFLMSDADGNAVIHSAASGLPVAIFKEGTYPFTAGEIDFDGRKWFGQYVSHSNAPRGHKQVTAVDDRFPICRRTIVGAQEGNDKDLATSAEWAARKAFAEGLAFPLDLPGWYTDPGPLGTLWAPNTIVSVISPTLFMPNGFDFLVTAVEYRTDGEQVRVNLNLVAPTAYQTLEVQKTQLQSWKARMMLLKAIGTPLEKALMDEATAQQSTGGSAGFAT